jgi:hypothetical protein
VIKLTANESLIVCDMECFSPASCKRITTHLEINSILAVECDLANVVFFFPQDDIDLADVILLVKFEKFNA